jgi:predicted molibdopterin-dependent oxidoreductase YjgC
MFRRLREPGDTVEIVVDGRAAVASETDTVAAALLVLGVSPFRRTHGGNAPRTVWCGMGACFDCLVTVDGEGNRQACLTPVRPGMTIETGARLPPLPRDAGR